MAQPSSCNQVTPATNKLAVGLLPLLATLAHYVLLILNLLVTSSTAAQYKVWYDFRSHKRLDNSKDEPAGGQGHGVVEQGDSTHLGPFIPQRQPATADHFRQLLKEREQQQESGGVSKQNSSSDESKEGSASKFDMQAAMKGAQVKEQVSEEGPDLEPMMPGKSAVVSQALSAILSMRARVEGRLSTSSLASNSLQASAQHCWAF